MVKFNDISEPENQSVKVIETHAKRLLLEKLAEDWINGNITIENGKLTNARDLCNQNQQALFDTMQLDDVENVKKQIEEHYVGNNKEVNVFLLRANIDGHYPYFKRMSSIWLQKAIAVCEENRENLNPRQLYQLAMSYYYLALIEEDEGKLKESINHLKASAEIYLKKS